MTEFGGKSTRNKIRKVASDQWTFFLETEVQVDSVELMRLKESLDSIVEFVVVDSSAANIVGGLAISRVEKEQMESRVVWFEEVGKTERKGGGGNKSVSTLDDFWARRRFS